MHVVILLLTHVLCADVSLPLPTPESLRQQLRSARSEVVVDGVTLVLRADLNRDFALNSPPDGHPMVGVLAVASKEWRRKPPARLPFEAEIEHVWILRGDTVLWKPQRLDSEHVPPMLPSTTVRDGPKLEPGTTVDVVVRFAVRKVVYFLRAQNVRITRSM